MRSLRLFLIGRFGIRLRRIHRFKTCATGGRIHRLKTCATTMLLLLVLFLPVGAALGQDGGATTAANPPNPISILENSAEAIPGFEEGLSPSLNIIVLLTILSLAPSILIMCTCFPRIVIVLGLMRQAMGTHTLPPTQIIIGTSLLLTFMVMAPTIDRIYDEAIVPYQNGDPEVQSQLDVWNRAKTPVRDFMFAQIEATGNWEGVYTILEYRGVDTTASNELTYDDIDMLTLVPAFIMSELKVAFLIAFRVYLPFLVIDMVIASLLISMGMLMLPPVLISLPFKLLLFVLVDGWNLVIGNLITGFVQSSAAGVG